LDAARLPAPVIPDLARIGLTALPAPLLGRLAEWDRLDERQQEAAAAEVRRLAGLLAPGRG